MSVNEVVPLLTVSDMQASIAFYVDGLGFRITNEWRPDGTLRWCQIRLGSVGFMLQQFPTEGHDARPMSDDAGAGVAFCLFCDDAVELYHELRQRGIEAQEPVVGNALWVTHVEDPDGYCIDFESPTDLPEETRLSDTDRA